MLLSRQAKRLLAQVSQYCEQAGRSYLDEYKLIKKNKSKLTARQRSVLVYFIEQEIKKVKDKENEK